MRRTWLHRAASAGIDAVVTKLAVVDDGLLADADDAGVEILGSFTCYSDHDPATALPGAVRPVGADGGLLEPVEWYRGLVPGDPGFDDRLVDHLADQMRRVPTRVVLLDFLRWPGHWELESRHGGSPRASSFDPGTLRRFRAYLAAQGIDPSPVDPHRPVTSASVISRQLAGDWTDFRVGVVGRIADRLGAVVRAAGGSPGAFLVPADHERRRTDYGQDVVLLSQALDLFAPMTYQAMTGLDARATLRMAEETTRLSGRPTIAMVQTTSAPEYRGAHDWGPPITAQQVAATAALLGDAVDRGHLAGLCLFPGEALCELPDLATHPEGHPR